MINAVELEYIEHDILLIKQEIAVKLKRPIEECLFITYINKADGNYMVMLQGNEALKYIKKIKKRKKGKKKDES